MLNVEAHYKIFGRTAVEGGLASKKPPWLHREQPRGVLAPTPNLLATPLRLTTTLPWPVGFLALYPVRGVSIVSYPILVSLIAASA